MKRAYRVNFTKPHNIAVGIFIESRAGAATVALIRHIVNIIIIECNFHRRYSNGKSIHTIYKFSLSVSLAYKISERPT